MLFRQGWPRKGTGIHPPDRWSSGTGAATPRKFYHRASAGYAYRAGPARPGRSWRGSAAQSPVSAPARLPAPEIRRRGCGLPPARREHALPEAGGGEEHGVRRVLEALEEHRARRSPLKHQRKLDARAHSFKEVVHLGVAGKKTEGAALAQLQKLHDFVGSFSGETRVAHIGHFLREIQQRLLLKVELGGQSALLRMVEAEALADKLKAAGDRECGRSEDHGVEGLE